MAEHLPYYGHEQGCYNSKIPWGPEPCPGCVALRRAFSQGQRDERERIRRFIIGLTTTEHTRHFAETILWHIDKEAVIKEDFDE